MSYKTTLIAASLLALTLSCKTKKNLIQKPSTPVETSIRDAEIDKIKKDMPQQEVERTEAGIKFTFSSEILFPTNSSILNEDSKKKITDLAKVIQEKENNRQILIEGHSDKTGTAEYNQWLSEKRAVSVKTQLVKLGIDAQRIKTSGLGDTRPIADNKTKEGRLKNRRVEVTLLKSN
ncbi:OmpA family protein [Pedobacter nutrimenti]|uniref:OmpA family protein n=1 Tax=Pedobacter nutrimenti TaxID=1241337 RepID=A0A318UNM8_9SPHI|nr:OmpA family protein [Pedobacter nutrimenti]PYF71611.1 OmpA family protein [Pedobacter nutrimenti]